MPRIPWRPVIGGLLVAGLLLAAVGEAVVRLFGHTLVYEPDARLGWRPLAGQMTTMRVQDAGGTAYEVRHRTLQHGFRAFGRTDSGRPRVLVIGDSFTADPSTEADGAYFGILGQRLPVEVFAIGGGGYGTLQELMLAEPLLALVRPDVLVLQYCINDLSDNSYELEGRTSFVRNQKNLRPYWVGDGVGDVLVYRMAPWHPYRLLHDHSRLFRKLDIEWMKLQYLLAARRGAPDAGTPAERAAAAALTTRLMTRLGAALPAATRRFSISCNTTDAGEAMTWKTITEAAGFVPLPEVSGSVEASEKQGTPVRTIDGFHWNRAGHRIAGEALAQALAERMK